jgi:hypothetical protein
MLEGLDSQGLLRSEVVSDKGETEPTLANIDFLAGGERIPGDGILKV